MTKSQIPISKRIRFGKLVKVNWILIGYWLLVIGIFPLYAQDTQKLVTLSKQIIEAEASSDAYPALKEAVDLYFNENKYNECVEFLNSLTKQKKELEPALDYYIGLTRYRQMKYLEEKQSWDEYFAQGNAYRDQITESLQKAKSALSPLDTLAVYSQLMLWKFHRDQQDAFSDTALADLMNTVGAYASGAADLAPLKDVAAEFSSYGEKGKAKETYKIYIERLVASQIKEEELNNIAAGFYKEGNLDLAEGVYDVYIERITQAEKTKKESLPVLVNIAQKFSYKDEGLVDPAYAEKIFKKIEEIGVKDAFNEELLYLRAFNLEKAKEYSLAKDIYLDLVRRYPASICADEAEFKIGIVYTYVLRDIKTGRAYFEKLAQKETLSPQVISSLYQLGLLSQWEKDFVRAGEYYHKLLEKAKDGFADSVAQARQRLQEIDEAKPMEYNLSTFLDVSFKEEYAAMDMSKLELKSHPYRAKQDEGIDISSQPYLAETGCLQVQLQYLWSGDLGSGKPSLDDSAFNITYILAGTKVINAVVISSSSGIIDRNIDLIDVY